MEKERPAPRWVPTGPVPKSRFENIETNDLTDYLDDDFNFKVYSELRRDRHVAPLEYFKSFYKMLSFVTGNLKRPLELEQQFEEVDPGGWNRGYILTHLLSYSEMLAKVGGKPTLRNSLAMKHIALLKLEFDSEVEEDIAYCKNRRSESFLDKQGINVKLDNLSHFRERKAYLIRLRTTSRDRLRQATEFDEHVFKDGLAWINDKLAELDDLEKLKGQKMFDEPDPDNATPESKNQFDLSKEEKLLASICPLFRDARPDTQQKVWSKLSGFTRNQWAMFLIEAHPKKKDYASKAEAANALIKPIAKSIEAISGRTNMRGVVFNENSKQYAKDESDVKGITQILFADSIMRKSD